MNPFCCFYDVDQSATGGGPSLITLHCNKTIKIAKQITNKTKPTKAPVMVFSFLPRNAMNTPKIGRKKPNKKPMNNEPELSSLNDSVCFLSVFSFIN